MKKFISGFAVIFSAVFFLFSAYVKIEPLEPFKFVLAEHFYIKSWWLVELLSRVIIGTEIFIGLCLITFTRVKFILRFSIGFIAILSIYLIYIWIRYGASEDCGCFGEYLQLSAPESLIKNILLLGVLFFSYKSNTLELKPDISKYLLFIFLLFSLIFPWLYNAPDKMYLNPYESEKNKYLNIEILNKFDNNYPADSLKYEKKIVCFFSTTCKFCAYTAKKLTLFQKNYNKHLPVYYVFWGDSATLKKFWEKTESYHFPYQLASPEIFFQLSGNQLPAVYFLKDAKIQAKHGYRTLDDKDILNFISE